MAEEKYIRMTQTLSLLNGHYRFEKGKDYKVVDEDAYSYIVTYGDDSLVRMSLPKAMVTEVPAPMKITVTTRLKDAFDKMNTERHPIGVMPRYIFLERRLVELNRAINDRSMVEYDELSLYDFPAEWISERIEIIETLKRLEEERK